MPFSKCGIDEQRGDLLSELTTGFEALLEKVEDLAARNAEFERQIKTYRTEGRTQFTPTKESFTSSDLQDGERGSRVLELNPEEDERIVKGIQAWELLRMSMTGTVPLRRKRWRKLSPNRTLVGPRPGLERDFTTQGTQGELKCPFSSKVPEIEEPHRLPEINPTVAEEGANTKPNGGLTSNQSGCARTNTVSNTESVPQCPIRFLNQMPAEDVAKYFEEHKHEIPRSHEICVKRYQTNEASIRSLDAKYGNLVNMLQGLGQKHQPMLPSTHGAEGEEEGLELDKKSIEKIGKWAENVEGAAPEDEAIDTDDKSEARTGHFERPLAEVRLGESPSRPWGVRVPARLATSTDIPEKDSIAAPVQPSTQVDSMDPATDSPVKRPAGRCPFGHGALKEDVVAKDAPDTEANGREASEPPLVHDDPISVPSPPSRLSHAAAEEPQEEQKSSRPIITFTGPVFFGYSAEDAAALMKSFSQI